MLPAGLNVYPVLEDKKSYGSDTKNRQKAKDCIEKDRQEDYQTKQSKYYGSQKTEPQYNLILRILTPVGFLTPNATRKSFGDEIIEPSQNRITPLRIHKKRQSELNGYQPSRKSMDFGKNN